MAAGLPGFGLSGVFFVVSALLMVPVEVVNTFAGRSSLARWRDVLRNAGLALAILAGVELTYAALHFAVSQFSGSGTGPHAGSGQPNARTVDVVHTLPVLPILGTLGMVVLVIGSAKVAEMLSDRRRRTRGGSQSAPPRAELLSFEERRRTPRPGTDLVNAGSARGHFQPHLAKHDQFVAEAEPRLRLASGRSR